MIIEEGISQLIAFEFIMFKGNMQAVVSFGLTYRAMPFTHSWIEWLAVYAELGIVCYE